MATSSSHSTSYATDFLIGEISIRSLKELATTSLDWREELAATWWELLDHINYTEAQTVEGFTTAAADAAMMMNETCDCCHCQTRLHSCAALT